MPTPPRTVATVPKRDGPKPENVGPDAEKDDMKRQRERITLDNYFLQYQTVEVYYIILFLMV